MPISVKKKVAFTNILWAWLYMEFLPVKKKENYDARNMYGTGLTYWIL